MTRKLSDSEMTEYQHLALERYHAIGEIECMCQMPHDSLIKYAPISSKQAASNDSLNRINIQKRYNEISQYFCSDK